MAVTPLPEEQMRLFPVGPAILRGRNTPRPQIKPATAMPLLMRNFLRVSDVFMNATLSRAHQIYFSNIAIFLGHHSMTVPPRPRRHSAALVKQRTE